MLAVIAALSAPLLAATGPAADPLVNVRSVVPDVVLDVRYATKRNFLGRAVYPKAAAFLRRPAALRLKKAADLLRAEGYRLVVFDAYRPFSVQTLMWKVEPNRLYVADPARGGSVHNRGGAVDVSLADAAGRELEMPSPFDDFGPRAWRGAKGVPAAARRHLRILEAAMKKAGFKPLREEWWHYEDPDARAWPVLDVPLEDLK